MDILSNLCRTCNTQQEKLIDIYSNKVTKQNPSITEMLEYCTQRPTKVGQAYPQHICYFCMKQLELSYKFIKRLELSEREFETAFQHLEEAAIVKKQPKIRNVQNIDMEQAEVIVFEEFFDESSAEPSKPLHEISSKTTYSNKSPITREVQRVQKQHNISISAKQMEPRSKIIKLERSPVILPTSSKLNESLVKETNSPALICSLCSKSFFTSKALNLHFKISHKLKTISS